MLIMELARECKCCDLTIAKWAKDNNKSVLREMSANHKWSRALSASDSNSFRTYWRERQKIPDGFTTMGQLAKECGVHTKTLLVWAERNGVEFKTHDTVTSGHPTKIIENRFADEIRKEYSPSQNVVAVKPLLNKYYADWRVAERWATDHGKQFVKGNNTDGRKQKSLLAADAKMFESHLKRIQRGGFFYFIQLVPEYNPNRIKFGFAEHDISRRLRQHQTVCPNAKLIASWSCRRREERQAILGITKAVRCTALTDEVFECDNFQDLLDSANRYFHLPVL